MTRFPLFLLAAALLALPALLGVHGCQTTSPDTPPPAMTVEEFDAYAMEGQVIVEELAGAYADADDFNTCVGGVVAQGIADGIGMGHEIYAAVDAGQCIGQTSPWVIDPSHCIGLPGTPETPEEMYAAAAEVEAQLDNWIPLAVVALRFGAMSARQDGAVGACTGLTAAADNLPAGADLTVAILYVIENPGDPFPMPGTSWDCSACGGVVDDHQPSPAPLSPATPVTPAPAPVPGG